MRSVPARPLVGRLPLDQLTPDDFERLTHSLAAALYGVSAEVHRVGGPGHTQQGADVIVETSRDGRVVFQCKRVSGTATFGPLKVEQAARAADGLRADRRVLVLSRVASPHARERARELGWDIWDHADIVRLLQQDLPSEASRRVVRTFFPGYAEHFLGLGSPAPWLTCDEYFAGLLETGDFFSHGWQLVGRQDEMTALREWASSGESQFGLLVGAAGIGKTRLVLELVRQVARSRAVYLVEPNVDVRPDDFDTLDGGPTVVIVDDAHERQDIDVLVRGALRRGAGSETRVLFVTRPYGKTGLERSLAAIAPGRERPTVELAPLARSDARQLAAAVLGAAEHSPLVERVVAVTGDCTLLTVAAAHLLKTERIDPSLMANEDSFRSLVLDAWYDEYTRAIDGLPGALEVRDVLRVLSAVQPLDLTDTEAIDACSTVLGRDSRDELMQILDRLVRAGIVSKRSTRLRIQPDMLADHILADACYSTALARPTGYADRIWERVAPGLKRNLLVNLARIDWRLSVGGVTGDTLLGLAWATLEREFQAGGIQERLALLSLLKDAAHFQPRRSLELARWAMENEVPGEEPGFLGHVSTYADIRAAIPDVLRGCAYHVDCLDEACDLLWELAKNDRRPTGPHPEHPLRVLTDLASYSLLKPFEYSRRVIERALGWLEADGRPEALEVLDEALKWDAEDHVAEGYTIHMRSYSVPLVIGKEVVLGLRHRVYEGVLAALGAPDPPLSVRAAHSLGNAWRRPGRLFGHEPSEHESAVWAAEAAHLLALLREHAELAKLDASVRAELLEAVERLADSQEGQVVTEAQRVEALLDEDLDLELAEALMHGPWRRRFRRRSESATSEDEQERLRDVAQRLLAREKGPESTVRVVEERLNVAAGSAGQISLVPGPLIAALVGQEPAVAPSIVARVLEKSDSALLGVAGYALSILRRDDPSRALELARALIATNHVDARRQVAYAYGWGLASAPGVNSHEIQLMRELAADDDVFVARNVAGGLRQLAASEPALAVEILLDMRIGRSSDLADDALVLFSKGEPLSIELLDEDALDRIFEELKQCTSIDEYWVERFLGQLCARALERVIDLLKRRVELAEVHDFGYDDYRPLPFGWEDKTPLSSKGHASRRKLLEELREWAAADVPGWRRHFDGPRLFAAVVGDFDDEALGVLEAGLSGPLPEAKRVAHLLSEIPRSIIWQDVPWVSRILENALRRNADLYKGVASALHSAITSGVRSGTPGQPYPQDLEQRDRARKIADKLPLGSAAERFYRGLQRSAEADIKRKGEDDEEWS